MMTPDSASVLIGWAFRNDFVVVACIEHVTKELQPLAKESCVNEAMKL